MANNKRFPRCVGFNACPWPSLEPFAAEETPRKASATHSSCPWRRCLQAPSRAPQGGQGKESWQLQAAFPRDSRELFPDASTSTLQSSSSSLRGMATVRTGSMPGEREIVTTLLIPELLSHFFPLKLPFSCTKYLLSVQWKQFHLGEGIIHFARLWELDLLFVLASGGT